jgi:hypothetical protein
LGGNLPTHSFISAAVVRRLDLQLERQPGLTVGVANGGRVTSNGVCRATQVLIDSEEFVLDLFVIPLDGFDMVLGVQWLCSLGLILWDFDRCRMSCWRVDHQVIWQGIPQRRTAATANALAATDLMHLLLQEFDDVFATPTGLPPVQRHNHRIHLLPDTPPVAVRPYRYMQLMKDELERQCTDMLN